MTGVLSGFGKGAQKGLETFQSYVNTSALQEERNKLELERLRLTEGYAAAREQRGYAHAEQLQKQGFEHAEQLETGRRGHAEAMTGMEITSREAIAEQDRAQRKALHEDEAKLKGRELDITEQHYKDMAPWYKRYGVDSAKLNPLLKAQVDTLVSSAKNAREAAAKYDELAGKAVEPDKQADLMKMAGRERESAAQREQQAFALLGITLEKAKNAAIIDPDEQADTPKPGEAKPSQTPSVPAAQSDLPMMGNPLKPTQEDIAAYLREHEEATRRGSGVAAVVEKFRKRFGRVPTDEEMTAVSRRGLLQQPAQ